MRRVFLDWKEPPLVAATRWLVERYTARGGFDLSSVVVVVPTGRSARRLLELLVLAAEEAGRGLKPPQIVTPEAFPELLYPAQRPLADASTQQLAWVKVLREAPPSQRAAVLPHPPEDEDLAAWLAVADMLRRLHVELAADGLDCQKVLDLAARVDGFAEHARWEALCRLQRRYLDELDALDLWDVQTARLVAIRQREIAIAQDVVLLGTVDLNLVHRQMLDQIADRVTALVAAPPELAARFDAQGCLRPEAWKQACLDLPDEAIELVEGPADQAEAAVHWLARLQGAYRADQIVLALPDHRLAPYLERHLDLAGVRSRDPLRQQVGQTGPWRLLAAAARYASQRRFADLAALVRHPDLQDWLLARLREQGQTGFDLLTALDEFASQRLPAVLPPRGLPAPAEEDVSATQVRAILQVLDPLVAPLAGRRRPLGRWAEPLREVLRTVYGRWEIDLQTPAGYMLAQALQRLKESLDHLAALPGAVQPAVRVWEACRFALEPVAEEGIVPPSDPEAIELIGWLDLPLDDAPAALVTTFNEGWIPSSTTVDLFLPNQLRQQLGLVHNDRRLARDAYAARLVAASRAEHRWIVARRDPEGNVLVPSRLLFLAEDATAFRRARRMFGVPPPARPRASWLTVGPSRDRSALTIPRPEPLPEPITELRVTQFRDYLACPYRFYLRHVRRLKRLDDQAVELDGAAFGNLAHAVLELFGSSADAATVRRSEDPQPIARFLERQLDQLVKARFGTRQVHPAVQVQKEQLRLRLEAFADWQAQRNAEGWQIAYTEDTQSRQTLAAMLCVDDQPFTIRGRIDRIDWHPRDGRLCILDYKTADEGLDPERTHRRRKQWVDLQLPLYRHLLGALPELARRAEQIELGYILLPNDLDKVGLAAAAWSEEELAEADALAEEVIRQVRAEVFWPPASPPPAFADDLAVICQEGSLEGSQVEDAAA